MFCVPVLCAQCRAGSLQMVCPLILLAIQRGTKARDVKPHATGHLAGNLIGKITLLS